MTAVDGTRTLIAKVGPRLVAPTGLMLPNTEGLARVVLITPPGPPLALVKAPPTFNVLAPSENAKESTAPVIVAVEPAILLPPTTLIDRSPTAPPTAPFSTLALPSARVPVLAPAVVVSAPLTVVFGASAILPSPAKLVAVMLVDPLLKLTVPPPATFNVVANTGPW